MLTRVGTLVLRRRKPILILAAITFVVAGAWGGGVSDHMSSGGFDDPGSESFKADQALDEAFGTATPNFLLVVTADSGNVDDPAAAAAGTAITEELAGEPDLQNVVSYWTLGNAPPLKSDGGDRALVIARIEGDQNHVNDYSGELVDKYTRDDGTISVAVGGFGPVFNEVGHTIEDDLVRAETIAFPITLILLLLVFGSVVSSSLPLAIGLLSIVGSWVVLRLLTMVTEVSIFSLNLTTAMGLGLAIDYSLFMVNRYREELHNGYEPDEAVRRTVRTAGRTVAFSAGTVAASLCALLVFPLSFLRSFAYAGVAVSFLAGVFSVVVLPAMLGALGRNVDKFRIFHRTAATSDHGFWHRMALFVMRRPWRVTFAAVAVLLVLGAPFLNIRMSLPDDRVQQAEAKTRAAHDVIREEFSSQEAGAASVVAIGIGDPATRLTDIDAYASALAQLPDVSRIDAYTGSYCGTGLADDVGCAAGQKVLEGATGRYLAFNTDNEGGGTYLSVVPDVEPYSADGERLVKAIRAVDAPFDVDVSGQSAQLLDTKSSLFGKLPIALGIIAVITFCILFMQFGSVLIPIKALVLNLLSLTATFGAMVFIFQEGNLSGVLDFTSTGQLDTTTPILMFCVAFGLSMDYEVFMLSRIKEEHDRTGDNEHSVAVGLERTGRLVTAAALLIAVVFISFATSDITFIKMFGVGLTVAVLVDAFIIRGTLVPAFMRLAGEWNWWAPGPMRRFHDRFGMSEHVDLDAELDSIVADDAGRTEGELSSVQG